LGAVRLMPYRIELSHPRDDAFDRLIELGALDVDVTSTGIAAVLPDAVDPTVVSRACGANIRISPAHGRDAGSVWVVKPRPVRVGRLLINPADAPAEPGGLRMIDGPVFGTGLHATTALALEMLDAELAVETPADVLDVGTGSGILALAALAAGVPRAVAIDIDGAAVRAAFDNARLNGLRSRLRLLQGGPEAVAGAWPLVLANVLAAPLIAMAPALSRRVASSGRLIVSGARSSLGGDVERSYCRTGLRLVSRTARDGWTALVLHASW
jgi:ribosomal protein L11 methyltransferase